MFEVGQKILCIDGHFSYVYNNMYTPKKGHIYTVREILSINYSDISDSIGLLLEEIINKPKLWSLNPHLGEYFELPFWYKRFAPLKKTETSISVFQEILNKTPELV